MALLFGFDLDSTHSAIIFELGSEADEIFKASSPRRYDTKGCVPDTPGLIVGSSEWGWISKDQGDRICAALSYFSEVDTDVLKMIGRMQKHRG